MEAAAINSMNLICGDALEELKKLVAPCVLAG
ncbi:hypothetical protein LCGC14_1200970, partial [marine sediment metagenome]